LELNSSRGGLGGDELKCFKVTIPLSIVQRNYANAIPWNLDQIGVGELKVVAGNSAGEVIAKAKREAEMVEATAREQIEVSTPETLVVVPRLVLSLAHEQAHRASHGIRWRLIDHATEHETMRGFRSEADPIRKFQQAIDESPRINSRKPDRWPPVQYSRLEAKTLRVHPPIRRSQPRTVRIIAICQNDKEVCRSSLPGRRHNHRR
jgi:hypothetical protein